MSNDDLTGDDVKVAIEREKNTSRKKNHIDTKIALTESVYPLMTLLVDWVQGEFNQIVESMEELAEMDDVEVEEVIPADLALQVMGLIKMGVEVCQGVSTLQLNDELKIKVDSFLQAAPHVLDEVYENSSLVELANNNELSNNSNDENEESLDS